MKTDTALPALLSLSLAAGLCAWSQPQQNQQPQEDVQPQTAEWPPREMTNEEMREEFRRMGLIHPDDMPAPVVELALCLDTSGSMDGLLEAAKTKLWSIVNELATAKPTPALRVALLTFGNDGHEAENGWVRVDCAFTDDLDIVSQQLFALSTNGGTELVGRVVHKAATDLDWTDSADGLRLIVVAGNESADQDREITYQTACREAIGRDIMVNSIYCGDPNDGIAPGWRDVALLADGQYAAIDHNNGTVEIATPFDAELATLSSTVNTTYLAFGAEAEWFAANQRQQDAAAGEMSAGFAAERAQTKAGALYNCSWDLVDACRLGQIELKDVAEEDLPENMKAMTLEERQAYVDQQWEERQTIQAQIRDLSLKRQTFIETEMARQGLDDSFAFDRALRDAIRAQAAKCGLTFPEPTPPATESEPADAPAEPDTQPDEG